MSCRITISNIQDVHSQQIAYSKHKLHFLETLKFSHFYHSPQIENNKNKNLFKQSNMISRPQSDMISRPHHKIKVPKQKQKYIKLLSQSNNANSIKKNTANNKVIANQKSYKINEESKKQRLCLKKAKKNQESIQNIKQHTQVSTSHEFQQRFTFVPDQEQQKNSEQFIDESFSYISYSQNQDQQDQKKLQLLSLQVKKQFFYSKADGFDKMRLQAQQIMQLNVKTIQNYCPIISNYQQIINLVTKGKEDLNFPSTFKYQDGVDTCQKIVYFFLTRYGIGKKTNNALFCFSAILRDSIIKIMGHQHWKVKQPNCLPSRATELIKMGYNTKHIDLLGKNLFKKLFYIFFLWLYDKNFTTQLVVFNQSKTSQIFKQGSKIKLTESQSKKTQNLNLKIQGVKIQNIQFVKKVSQNAKRVCIKKQKSKVESQKNKQKNQKCIQQKEKTSLDTGKKQQEKQLYKQNKKTKLQEQSMPLKQQKPMMLKQQKSMSQDQKKNIAQKLIQKAIIRAKIKTENKRP